MQVYTGHTEPWGSYLDIKINAPDILKKELSKNKKGVILFSSVTDPYQAVERKFQLTRNCLKILLPYQWPISILTKSDLVLRDIDLFAQFKDCEIGLSINAVDEKTKKVFEPFSSTTQQRLNALQKLHEAGLKTYAFISPLLPGLFDLEKIFARLSDRVGSIGLENLNPYKKIWPNMYGALRQNFPTMVEKYKNYFTHKESLKNYWSSIGQSVNRLAQKYHIPAKLYFH
jgi:DNA repair photolyase